MTYFAALLKRVHLDCKDTALPNPLLTNFSVKFLTYEVNTRKPYNDKLCLFRTLALHLHGDERLESETSKLFTLFLEKTGGIDPANFRGVCKEVSAVVGDFDQADTFSYDTDILDGLMIGELVRRNVGKHSKTVRLLRYKSRFSHVCNINALLKTYPCPSSDQFIKTVQQLEWHLTTCRELVEHVFP